MEKTILHCDCNSFYASVETILNPALKGIPMAVGGSVENRRGIILAKNDLAKACGVLTAETIGRAKQKCPTLTIVRPHPAEYSKYSRQVNEIYQRYTDLVEPYGLDESYLDITNTMHLFGTGQDVADKLRAVIAQEIGLTVSVGVSYNKAFAKLSSDYKKPNATTCITRENYRAIAHPLPVTALMMVGKSVYEVLKRLQIKTIGDLACANQQTLIKELGKLGEVIHHYANGLDDSPVRSASDIREVKSVGNGLTFKRNLTTYDDVKVGVEALSDEVSARMRRHKVKCMTVQVHIKDANFKTISRQKKLDEPTNLSSDLIENAMALIQTHWNFSVPIRMLTITGTQLVEENNITSQLSLFDDDNAWKKEKELKLENMLDDLKNKFGTKIIKRGSIITNDIGIDDEHIE